MPRKDRVPNPPKRPQGPQRRSGPTDPAAAERRRRLLLLGGVAAAVAVAGILAFVFLGGGGGDEDDGVAAAFREAGCTFQAVPALPGDHSAKVDATSNPKWNTDPPTSGPHYGTPAVYGSYDEPLQLAQVVHNLEHGAMFVMYGPKVPEATVAELQGFYDSDPLGMLLAPLPSLGDKIALGAWTVPSVEAKGTAYLAKCTAYEEDVFERFRDEYRFRGPERFPPELLAPGST